MQKKSFKVQICETSAKYLVKQLQYRQLFKIRKLVDSRSLAFSTDFFYCSNYRAICKKSSVGSNEVAQRHSGGGGAVRQLRF